MTPVPVGPQSPCPYCGQPSQVVWVHGHGQCSVCHTNIDECCRGETCQPEGATPR